MGCGHVIWWWKNWKDIFGTEKKIGNIQGAMLGVITEKMWVDVIERWHLSDAII